MSSTKSIRWQRKFLSCISRVLGLLCCCCWTGRRRITLETDLPAKHTKDCPIRGHQSNGDAGQNLQLLMAEMQRCFEDLKTARRQSCYQHLAKWENSDDARPRRKWPFSMASGNRQTRCRDDFASSQQNDQLSKAESAFSAAMNELSSYFDHINAADMQSRSKAQRDRTAPNCRSYHDTRRCVKSGCVAPSHLEQDTVITLSRSDVDLLSDLHAAASNVRLLYQLLVDMKWSTSNVDDYSEKQQAIDHEKRMRIEQDLNDAIAHADQLKAECLDRNLTIPQP